MSKLYRGPIGGGEDEEEKLLKAENEEANKQIEKTEGELGGIKKDVEENRDYDGIMARISALEGDMKAYKERVNHADAPYAREKHDHDMPKGLKALLDSFSELELEDVIPERKHPLYRPLRGKK